MANKILIQGPSGSGKTHAIRTLNPKETFIICPDEKSLPFKGWKSMYKTVYFDNGEKDMGKTNFYKQTDPMKILGVLQLISQERTEIKVAIIDTITHMMISDFMQTIASRGAGGDVFSKYTDMSKRVYDIFKIIDGLRDDLTVIVISHTEETDLGGTIKSEFKVPGGKLLKEKIHPASMFTVVLETMVERTPEGETKYWLLTQNNGYSEAKSPEGMFPELKIPNDYKYVLECIDKYEKGE